MKCGKLAGFDAETELKQKGEEKESNKEEIEKKIKVIVDPGQPTQEEIDIHEVTHCPFKRWCAQCVRGQAGEDPAQEKS